MRKHQRQKERPHEGASGSSFAAVDWIGFAPAGDKGK